MAVAAVVAIGFDLLKERLGGSAVVFRPKRIGFERLLQCSVETAELVESGLPLVHRLFGFGALIHFRMVFLDSPVRLAIW
jgi:hypothetical protein